MNNPRHYAMIRNLIIDLCGPLLQIDVNRINERFHQQGISAENPYMTLYREGRVKAFLQQDSDTKGIGSPPPNTRYRVLENASFCSILNETRVGQMQLVIGLSGASTGST